MYEHSKVLITSRSRLATATEALAQCPDVSLMLVVAAYAGSHMVQHESGLLATTVMGIALANQRFSEVKHIVEFKENLRVLILSTLFILLAARLEAEALAAVWAPSLGYLAFLVFIARPATVWVSCLGSKLTGEERIFLGWMAPRGIVAAAVASIFSSRLMELGYEGAELLVPITFLVILYVTLPEEEPLPAWAAPECGLAKVSNTSLLLMEKNVLLLMPAGR